MRTAAMKQRMGLTLSDAPVFLTKQLIEQYLEFLTARGRKKQTILTYHRSMDELYDYLSPEEEIKADTLQEWNEYLKASGYSDSTVNIRLSAANGFLRFCGREELSGTLERVASEVCLSELTRAEYMEFLSKVCEIGSEKNYLLIKVFASLDVNIGELRYLTVEACREGFVHVMEEKTVEIPNCLREELLQYANHSRITAGPIFVTRDGKLMDRSNITNSIRKLAIRAGMAAGKCCPSALHRLYLTTQRELMEQLQPIYSQSYESLLHEEQRAVVWKG